MASTIAAGLTSGTALSVSGDTSGQLVLQTNGTTTAVTISTGQVVTLAQPLPVASGGSGVTTSTGTGAVVLGTSPTLTTPVLSGTITGTYTLGGTPTVTGTLTAGTSLVKNPYSTCTQTVQAHGLSTTPSFVVVILECLTIDAGWAVGDKLPMSAGMSGFNVTPSFQVFWDGTNIQLNLLSSAPGVLHKTSGSSANITVASWKMTVVPYKLT